MDNFYLQGAVKSENYALVAKLRDEISKLEAESLAVSAKALAHENANYSFCLGQRVRHKNFGYRAIVCGMDGNSSSCKVVRVLISHFIRFWLMCMQTPTFWWPMLLRKIYWRLTNQTWMDLTIHIFPSYSMGWMQLVISSLSSNYVRSTTNRDMKYQSMGSLEMMLRQTPAFSNRS